MVSSEILPGTPAETIRIAAVTNDGMVIAPHFGMAEYYQVITVEKGKIIGQEKRPKPHHTIHPKTEESQQHDHQDMLAPIRDCQVLFSGGMRSRAYEHVQAAGLQVFMTVGNIDEAVKKYLNGDLISDMRRVRAM